MIPSLILLLATLCLLAHALIEPNLHALTWKFNGTDFWAPVHLDSSTYHFQSPGGLVPSGLGRRDLPSSGYLECTVITLNSSIASLSAAAVDSAIQSYSVDDVWSRDQFLGCLFVQYSGASESIPVDPTFGEYIKSKGVKTVFVATAFTLEGLSFPENSAVLAVSSACELGNGPYIATLPDCQGAGLGMTPVYALQPDYYEAFMEGSFPDASELGRHQHLHVSLPGARLPNIIIPSKLSSTNSGAGPLAGLRFGVKDIFHVKGLKTSGGSRAYYETYSYQNFTSETVQLCLDAGAELIGKTKTIAFALGTPYNGMEVDYQDPWNARGDGYQTTGGSSSGSGAAVTAYDWVDFALGTDTGGSVRFPARFGGFYGYKPTHGIFNLTGILVAIAEQDTPGFMARSPEIFTRIGRVWAEGKPFTPLPSNLPKKILRYSDQPTNISQPAAKELIETFFANLTAAFDLFQESINMTQAFLDANVSASDPPQTQAVFLKNVYADQNSVQGWDEIGAPLTEAYGKIPGRLGASPPVDPPVNVSWVDGQNETTRARYPDSQRRRLAFGDFYNREVLPANDETCSEYIFAHSYHTPPSLAKVAPHTATLVVGWYDGLYANYAGVPEVVIPIGQVEHLSPYTKRIEWQPVTVTLGVAKGCDLVLFELVDRLAAMGLIREVLPGVTAYPVD